MGRLVAPLNLQPSEVQHAIFDTLYSDLKYLKVIDKTVVTMDHGLKSLLYHFWSNQERDTVSFTRRSKVVLRTANGP